jgi:DDE superfamily endonuclease
LTVEAVAVAFSMAWPEGAVQDGAGAERERGRLAGFRRELYRCLARRGDALFELADAVLCKQDRVHMAAELSLEPECRRGHGAVYDALNCGEVRIGRLRRALAGLPLPAWADGRIRLTADVSNWLRPDAEASPGRLFCHCYARGKGNAQLIPGWPYSVVAALEPGRTSWTLPLDAVRLGPADDATAVTAAQIRGVIGRLIEAGHWRGGDPDILIVFDCGYDLTRLAWLPAGLPVEVAGRLRSDRVMYFPAPPRPARPAGTGGRPPRHGAALKLASPHTWPAAAVTTSTETTRYGTARAMAWGRLHQRLASRAGWEDHDGELPLIEGTLIRLQVDHLPGDRSPEPLWLWSSRAAADADAVNRTWQAFLRRFDIEHRNVQVLQAGPRLDPAQAARPGRRRPVDLAHPRLLRPAAARPPPRRRHPPALAAALPARPPDPRPGPPRVPEHPPDAARSGQRAETRQARTRPPARLNEPAPSHPPRRGQNRQARQAQEENPQADG